MTYQELVDKINALPINESAKDNLQDKLSELYIEVKDFHQEGGSETEFHGLVDMLLLKKIHAGLFPVKTVEEILDEEYGIKDEV